MAKSTYYGKLKFGNWTKQEEDWLVGWAKRNGMPDSKMQKNQQSVTE
ncbi:hypothetical protein QNI16_17560 [Cytophagaceae bacterium YF14B1]|uniref:Uncharacterized protein n=1 Tax=Xanthocytophaga flava TaxID=3048013 RepID=A0AAE3QMZ0_9BACT|nr:hypothetical protein [Xanthocytophaga flavus]MDJ1482317.1 hypothetical protein [Xanthocytophaga flavus]